MKIDPKKIDFEKIRHNHKNEENGTINQGDDLDVFSNFTNINNVSENSKLIHKYKDDIFNDGKLMKSFGLLSLSFRMFAERWKKMLVLNLLLLAFFVIVNGIFVVTVSSLLLITKNFVIAIILLMLLSLIFYISLFIIIISMIKLFYNKDIGIVDSIKESKNKIKLFFLTSLLTFFFVIGLVSIFLIIPGIIFALLLIAHFFINSSLLLFQLTNILSLLMVFIVSAIIIFSYPIIISISVFSSFTMVLDNVSPIKAITYSCELVRGKIYAIFWRFFVLFLVLVLCLIFIFFTISSLILFISGIEFIITLILFFIMFIFISIASLFIYNLYENLRVIKKDKIDKIGLSKNNTKIKILVVLGALIVVVNIIGTIINANRFHSLNFGSNNLSSVFKIDNKKDDLARQYNIHIIQSKLEDYFNANNNYPKSLEDLNMQVGSNEIKELYEYYQLNWGKSYRLCIKNKDKVKDCFYATDHNRINEIKDKNDNVEYKKRDKKRIEDLKDISFILLKYKLENNSYPISPTLSKLNENNKITHIIKSKNGEYIPVDPGNYYYGYISDNGTSFELSARLEDENSPYCDENIKNMCIFKIIN